MLLKEYHVDGLRYDQVTVIAQSGGWYFAQDLTNTLRYVKRSAVQIAEYWGNERWKGVAVPPDGMGFDIGYSDTLRDTLRAVIARRPVAATPRVESRQGARRALHDVQRIRALDRISMSREPRSARLQPSGATVNRASRRWRIRAMRAPGMRAAARKWPPGLLLTAPGVPMIFMGQEFLEDKYWSDWPGRPELLIWWEGSKAKDKHMSDQHRFTRDIMWLRRKHPALRGEGSQRLSRAQRQPRHRLTSLAAGHRPRRGDRRQPEREHVLQSQLSHRVSPAAATGTRCSTATSTTNGSIRTRRAIPAAITADGPAWDGLPASAAITLPANSILVFARDGGDF